MTIDKTKLKDVEAATDGGKTVTIKYTMKNKGDDGNATVDVVKKQNHSATVSACGDYLKTSNGKTVFALHHKDWNKGMTGEDGKGTGEGTFELPLTAEAVSQITADGNNEDLTVTFNNQGFGFDGEFEVTEVKVGTTDVYAGSNLPDKHIVQTKEPLTNTNAQGGTYQNMLWFEIQDLMGKNNTLDQYGEVEIKYTYKNNISGDRITPYIALSNKDASKQDGTSLPADDKTDNTVTIPITEKTSSLTDYIAIVVNTGNTVDASFQGVCEITEIKFIPKTEGKTE